MVVGLVIIAIGWLVAFLPLGTEPGPTNDSLVPILIGAEAVFLVGLVAWARVPAERRRAMVPYPKLIPGLAIWSLLSVAAAAAGSESLRRALAVVPESYRFWVAIVLSNALAVGITTALMGALVTFVAAARMAIRRARDWARSHRPSA